MKYEDLDNEDPLQSFQDEFLYPQHEGKRCTYLCGNSLGLQSKGIQVQITEQLQKWTNQGVEGHFTEPTPWLTMESIVKESMSKVVGAEPSEVVMMNTLTANVHFMMAAFYRPTEARHKILIEKRAFPSDIQATVSQILHRGFDPATSLLEIAPRAGEELLRIEDIEEMIRREGSQIALVHLSGVQYYTGQCFDIPRITAAGHAQGCVVGFDLAHSVGNVILQLHDWNVDFATWCSYKYLNCGPGSIGGCFVHSKHTESLAIYPHPTLPDGAASELVKSASHTGTQSKQSVSGESAKGPVLRLTGWWGHRLSDRFLMSGDFIAEGGANGFQVSNPSVLLIACVRASMDLFDKAGMDRLRAKSLKLTGYLETLIRAELADDVTIFTPSDPAQRGCQLSICFTKCNDLEAVNKQLKAKGVIVDTRKPNVMRVAPAPLYNSFEDVWRFVHLLKETLRGLDVKKQ